MGQKTNLGRGSCHRCPQVPVATGTRGSGNREGYLLSSPSDKGVCPLGSFVGGILGAEPRPKMNLALFTARCSIVQSVY